jgi:hypothetical protein
MEMEANKPGWRDSLNNLPGIFGSSVSETAELKRLVLFMKKSINKTGLRDTFRVNMPSETADLIRGLTAMLDRNLRSGVKKKDLIFWDKSSSLKEEYRDSVWHGFSGKEKNLSIKKIKRFLDLCSAKLGTAIEKSFGSRSGIPYTYYFHEVTKHKKTGKGKCVVKPLSFEQVPVPYFLEGPMHVMKVLDDFSARKRLYGAVRKSGLYDEKLRMYKINSSLEGMPHELGRSMIFTPGWLENESIWLHMEYKYLLEVLRGGLYDEFFRDIKSALVPFMDPAIYGRSILENSSFIVSSAHPDPSLHGTGYAARLSGSTTELISMWLHMAIGRTPFRLDDNGKIVLVFEPVLPEWLFTKKEAKGMFRFSGKGHFGITVPKDSFAFSFLGKVLVIYHNPIRKNTYGMDRVKPQRIVLKARGHKDVMINGNVVPADHASGVREGAFERVEVYLG